MDLKFVVFGFVPLGARPGATQLELRRSERRRGPCVSLGSGKNREEPRVQAALPSRLTVVRTPWTFCLTSGPLSDLLACWSTFNVRFFFTFMILQKEGNERAHDAFGRAVVRAPGDPKDQLSRT